MASEAQGEIPARETWYPGNRRRWIVVVTGVSVLLAVGAVAALASGAEVLLGPANLGLQAILFAALAWVLATQRVTADAEGLHVRSGWEKTTYAWPDIAEVRPNRLRSRRTALVLVRHSGVPVPLPITEEHLDAVRRWHRAGMRA